MVTIVTILQGVFNSNKSTLVVLATLSTINRQCNLWSVYRPYCSRTSVLIKANILFFTIRFLYSAPLYGQYIDHIARW